MRRSSRRGLSRVELIVVLTCAPIVIAIAVVALWPSIPDCRVDSRRLRDGTQARQIHLCLQIYADENGGLFPRPGLVDRKPIEGLGNIPGRGEEDVDLNTTANLFSMLIVQNFFTPELAVSPLERNPNVRVDEDYNYAAYKPADGSHWDTAFSADLSADSNVSYAHQPLVGRNAARVWTNQREIRTVLLGNRGPKDGIIDSDSHTCTASGWQGNVVFNDGAVESFDTTKPESLGFDNLFAIDDSHELDAFLTFTKPISEGVTEFQFD